MKEHISREKLDEINQLLPDNLGVQHIVTLCNAAIQHYIDSHRIGALFWYRPIFNGEMYEGPVHNSSKILRDGKPGEWVPLFDHPAEPVNAQLVEACEKFSALYGRLWDRADIDGAGLLSPESVKDYDEVHELMSAALNAAKASPAPEPLTFSQRKAILDKLGLSSNAQNMAIIVETERCLAPGVPFKDDELAKLTINGAKVWAGVDAQDLRDGNFEEIFHTETIPERCQHGIRFEHLCSFCNSAQPISERLPAPRMLSDAEIDALWGQALDQNHAGALEAVRWFARAILAAAGARDHSELVKRLRSFDFGSSDVDQWGEIMDESADALEGKNES